MSQLYWHGGNAFDAELVEKRMLTRSAFFEAIFDLFDEVVRATITTHKNAKQSSLQETVRVIAKIDFSAQGARLTKKNGHGHGTDRAPTEPRTIN